jgi:hypothetical protein
MPPEASRRPPELEPVIKPETGRKGGGIPKVTQGPLGKFWGKFSRLGRRRKLRGAPTPDSGIGHGETHVSTPEKDSDANAGRPVVVPRCPKRCLLKPWMFQTPGFRQCFRQCFRPSVSDRVAVRVSDLVRWDGPSGD